MDATIASATVAVARPGGPGGGRLAGVAEAEAAGSAFAGVLAAVADPAAVPEPDKLQPERSTPVGEPLPAVVSLPVDGSGLAAVTATVGGVSARPVAAAAQLPGVVTPAAATGQAALTTPQAWSTDASAAPAAAPTDLLDTLDASAGVAPTAVPGTATVVSPGAKAAIPATRATPASPASPADGAALPAPAAPAVMATKPADLPTARDPKAVPAASGNAAPSPAAAPEAPDQPVAAENGQTQASATAPTAVEIEIEPVMAAVATDPQDTVADPADGSEDQRTAPDAVDGVASGEAEPAATASPPPTIVPATTPQTAVQAYARVAALAADADPGRADSQQGDPGARTPGPAPAALGTMERALAALALTAAPGADVGPEVLATATGDADRPARAVSIRAQVAEQLTRGLLDPAAEQKLVIRLQPENLGRVDAEFSAADDRLTVVLRAESPEAAQALRTGARELTDAIAERGGRFQHVEVRVELREGAPSRQDRADDRPQDQKQDGRQDGRREGREDGRERRSAARDEARAAWARAWADLGQEG
ncbi:MAG: flagellar hook-length control protein FliK [bacterium]|nr:flagellar hook-length control protein FliK [bacterium]